MIALTLILGCALANAQLLGGVPGGFSESRIDDHPDANLLKFLALHSAELKLSTDIQCRLRLLDVQDFQSQVVAGQIHKFRATFDISPTSSCQIGGFNERLPSCQTFEILEKLDYECDTQDRSSCFEILETGACPDEQPDFDDKAGCAGCPTYGDINDESKAQELKNLALEIAEESLRNDNMWNDEDYCGINLISVENYASSVVAGFKHQFDAIFKFNRHCQDLAGKEVQCSDYEIFESLPFNCNTLGCLDIDATTRSNIRCVPMLGESSFSQGFGGAGCPGCESAGIIEDERNADQMKKIAGEAITLLARDDFDNEECFVNIIAVNNYRSQVVAGMLHKFDVEAKLSRSCNRPKAGAFTCSNLKVIEKLASSCELPGGKCYEALDTDDIECEYLGTKLFGN